MLASDFVTGAVIFLDEWDDNSRIVIPVTFGRKKIWQLLIPVRPTVFLTYIRFAVDPSENLFYFSGAP